MAKYSYEFKKKIVLEYLNTPEGYDSISCKYRLSSSYQLSNWVAAYQKWGDNGVKRSRSRKVYSFKKKISMVESYLTSEISYQRLALQVGINNPATLARWVHEFKAAGPDALRPHKKGRKKKLSTSKAGNNGMQEVRNTAIDTSVEHVKELENELLKLRIENAFLKEMRKLRLEDKAKMRDKNGFFKACPGKATVSIMLSWKTFSAY